MPVIGILGGTSPEVGTVALNLAAFRQALSEAGFVEGRNVAIKYRWAQRHYDRLPALAAELPHSRPSFPTTSMFCARAETDSPGRRPRLAGPMRRGASQRQREFKNSAPILAVLCPDFSPVIFDDGTAD